MKYAILMGLTALFISGEGCKKSESGHSAALAPRSVLAPSADTVARVHWLGKRQLGLEAGAYYLMRLWQLPESGNLEAQTINNLATAPWRLLYGEQESTNVFGNALRPLLADVVQQECYIEVHQPTNRAGEWVFAIRLDDSQVERWETYSAAVVQSLIDVFAVSDQRRRGWSIKSPSAPHLIELSHIGDWTLIGAADEKNALMGAIIGRIRRSGVPYIEPENPSKTKCWLEAEFDPVRTAKALGLDWNLPRNLPRVVMSVTGDGGNVLTHGELTFPELPPAGFEPWRIPTNRIHEPLVGLTAIRDIQSWLATWKAWNDLQIGAPPNQIFFWAPDGIGMQILAGVPMLDAANQVRGLSEVVVRRVNPWLSLHGVGAFEQAPDGNGIMWKGLSLIAPSARAVDQGRLALAALLPRLVPGTNTQADLYERPSLDELFQELSAGTNLVAFDWELTGPRVESCLYVGQALRVAFRRPQLPLQSTAAAWLYAIKPRLGNCTTAIHRTGTNQLSFDRKSSIGLTGAELNLLADWLESPQFPRGLYTLLAPADMPQTTPTPAKSSDH